MYGISTRLASLFFLVLHKVEVEVFSLPHLTSPKYSYPLPLAKDAVPLPHHVRPGVCPSWVLLSPSMDPVLVRNPSCYAAS
jgi:hypothetical protein